MYPMNTGMAELQNSVNQAIEAVLRQMLQQNQIGQHEINPIKQTLQAGAFLKFCNDFANSLIQVNPQTGSRYYRQYNPNELYQILYSYIIHILNEIRTRTNISAPVQMQMGGQMQMASGGQYPPGVIVGGLMVPGSNPVGMVNPGMITSGGNPMSEIYGPRFDVAAGLNTKVQVPNPTELRNPPMTRMEHTQPQQIVANPEEVAMVTNTIYKPPVKVINNVINEAVKSTEIINNDISGFDFGIDDIIEEDVTILDKNKENTNLMNIFNKIHGQKINSMAVYATNAGKEVMVLDVQMHSVYSNWTNAKNDFLNVLKGSSIRTDYPLFFYNISYYEKTAIDTPLLKVKEVLKDLKEKREAINTFTMQGFGNFVNAVYAITDKKLKQYIEKTIVDAFNKAAMVSLLFVSPENGQNNFITIDEIIDIYTLFKSISDNNIEAVKGHSEFALWKKRLRNCALYAINAFIDDRKWLFLDVVESEEDARYALAMEDNGIRMEDKCGRLIGNTLISEEGHMDINLISQLASRTIMISKKEMAYTNLSLPTKAMTLKSECGYHSHNAKNVLHQILFDLVDKYPVIQLDLTDTKMETDKFYAGGTLEDAFVIYRK